MWMLKDYDDRVAAQQVGEYELLMYEGVQDSKEKYEGKWYYVGFENSIEASGKWALVPRNVPMPANPYNGQYY